MDWITARLGCSLDHSWSVLCERIKTDLETWKATQAGDKVEFSVEEKSAVITRKVPGSSVSKITLRLKERTIAAEVAMQAGQLSSVMMTPLLNEKGECRVRIGNEELEFWQASRRVLEKFLFRDES